MITPDTTFLQFFYKINEEVSELCDAYINKDDENLREELADVIMVCLNCAKHFDIDIEQEIKNKIKINQERSKKGCKS